MEHVLQVKVLDARFGAEWPLPEYATAHSAGMDLRAALAAPLQLAAGQTALVPSGLAIHVGDPGMCAVLLPRSGLGHKHGIVLGNGTGLIDADYQGQVGLTIWNTTAGPFTVHAMDRLCQMMIVPAFRPEYVVVESFAERTERAAGGFGSTGVA